MMERVSAYADGELSPDAAAELEDRLGEDPQAAAFLADIQTLRRRFRYAAADEPPDVAAEVLDGISGRRRRPWAHTAVAVFVIGAITGAAFVGLARDRGPRVSAASIPDRVMAAQHHVTSVDAGVEIVERGWHPDVPERTYRGTLRYQAPERLAVELVDLTEYPGERWVPNDVAVVVDDGEAWASAPAACPREALPGCTPPQPRLSLLTGVEPFPDTAAAPLDLIVPVGSFAGAAQPEVIGRQRFGGRSAVGVRVSVAHVDPLLTGILGAGNWRAIHPTDEVELWLEEESLVPVALTVRAAAGEDRALWAVRRGYPDQAGDALLSITLIDLAVNEGSAEPFPTPPDHEATDAGFRSAEVDGPGVGHLPEGMTAHRSGTAGNRLVRSWSDGRAWVKVVSTTSWNGNRLFGDLGLPVRPLRLDNGIGYLDEAGGRLALRGDDIDLVVTGSVATEELARIAGSIAIDAQPVPATWAEAGSVAVAEALRAVPGLLLPDVDGFGPPAVAMAGEAVTVAYAGPGARGFTVVASSGDLAPPLEGDVRGVAVRGTVGRWSPDRGRLEWTEGEVSFTLGTRTLGLDELLDIAAGMDPP